MTKKAKEQVPNHPKNRATYVITSDNCNFRDHPFMSNHVIARKAPANMKIKVKRVITGVDNVKYFMLENGYYLSSIEPHTLFKGEKDANRI